MVWSVSAKPQVGSGIVKFCSFVGVYAVCLLILVIRRGVGAFLRYHAFRVLAACFVCTRSGSGRYLQRILGVSLRMYCFCFLLWKVCDNENEV